jgi:multimeric flavodoxin WrbA
MKIVILMSSNRKQGNTDLSVSLLEEELAKASQREKIDLEVEKVYLGDMNLGLCRGCRVCFDKGEEACPLKDDSLVIKAKIKAADGVITASPVYVDDINAVMKNWIDRLAHVCHRPEFGGKCAYLLVTVGSSRTSHALRTLDTALRTWGFHISGKSGYKLGARSNREEIHAKYRKDIVKAAQKIIQDIHRRRFEDPSFISLMIFKIQQKAWSKVDQRTIDYQYWHGQGWLDPRCTFFISHQANRMKVILARALGRLLAGFMS